MPQMPTPLDEAGSDRDEEQHHQRERDREADEPAERRLAASGRSALILSVTEPKVWPGRDDPEAAARDRPANGRRCRRVAGHGPLPRRLGSTAPAPGSGSVAHRRQVRRARPRVQLGEQRVVAHLGLQLRDAAVRIVEVAEDDGLGGHACWQAVTISPSRTGRSCPSRPRSCRVDALHAVGALLHDAAAAHRDVRGCAAA